MRRNLGETGEPQFGPWLRALSPTRRQGRGRRSEDGESAPPPTRSTTVSRSPTSNEAEGSPSPRWMHSAPSVDVPSDKGMVGAPLGSGSTAGNAPDHGGTPAGRESGANPMTVHNQSSDWEAESVVDAGGFFGAQEGRLPDAVITDPGFNGIHDCRAINGEGFSTEGRMGSQDPKSLSPIKTVNMGQGGLKGQNMLPRGSGTATLDFIPPQAQPRIIVNMDCTGTIFADGGQHAVFPPKLAETASVFTQSIGGARVSGKGWKKRARAVGNAPVRDEANCLNKGRSQVSRGGSVTLTSNVKRKAEMDYPDISKTYLIDPDSAGGTMKRTRVHAEILGLQESEAGVAVAETQPCCSL